jgi:hypothetical protein
MKIWPEDWLSEMIILFLILVSVGMQNGAEIQVEEGRQ